MKDPWNRYLGFFFHGLFEFFIINVVNLCDVLKHAFFELTNAYCNSSLFFQETLVYILENLNEDTHLTTGCIEGRKRGKKIETCLGDPV